MKTILYMATSLDGYIARENGETPWTDEEWQSFSNKVKEIGNLIIGRKTFEIMKKEDEFQTFDNAFIIVVSSEKNSDDSFQFVSSPEQALSLLKEKGFSKSLVAGGSTMNVSFLNKGLIDEIYLDIEPFIFGKGIKLFGENNVEVELKLLETRKFSKNTVQLHYNLIN